MTTPKSTLGRILRERAVTHPERALLVGDERLAYAQAARRSAQLARGLIALGAGKGAHVGLLYPDGADFVVGALAAARIGAVVVPLAPDATAEQTHRRLVDADVGVLLAAESFGDIDYVERLSALLSASRFGMGGRLLCPAVPQLRHLAISYRGDARRRVRDIAGLDHLANSIHEALLTALDEDVDESDPLAIVYTTGAVGESKGVVHTHGALLEHQRALNAVRGRTEGDTLVCAEPLHRIGGFASGLLAAVVAGATLVCAEALPDTPECAELRHGMLELAEAGGSALLGPDRDARSPGGVGRPAPGFEIRLADPESGAATPADEVGELCLRGPHLMQGYYKRSREDCFDADGWFHTGDLARVDGEGFVHLGATATELRRHRKSCDG
ncbi:AMP-binding protein [Nocardia takedensis]